MRIEAEGQELQREISTEVSRIAGGEAVAHDPEEAAVEERKTLLKKQALQQQRQGDSNPVPIKKIAIIVGATALAAVVLLLVLFWRGSSPSPVEQEMQDELKAEHSAPLLNKDGCPHRASIPKQCQSKDRLKNMSVFDKCSELFEHHGWDVAKLKSCGLIE